MSHQCWRSGQRNSTLRKKGLFAVWESIGLLLGTISFKSIQNRNRWGPERQAQHLSALRNFTPKSYDMYKKPRAAGLKTSPQSKTRRVHLPEPEIFTDRVEVGDDKPQAVTPIRLSKSDDKTKWQVRGTLPAFVYIYKCWH